MIDENFLRSHGAVLRKFTRNTVLFQEGHELEYHFQIVSGILELVRVDLEGRRITCKFLTGGDANYIVLNDLPLPFDVVAVTDCTVLVMPREKFLTMIRSEKGLLRHIFKFLSGELYDQMETNRKACNKSPAEKITELFQLLKYEETDQEIFSFEIDISTSEIAMMLGLSKKNCINTLQEMEDEGSVQVRNGKIFF